ncbi:MAG: hypothetical protein Q8O03_00640 [Nanoarchaeota archaeon]|nr:hypothetical protein [Nanoarchaeota archaeon]
MDKYQATKTLTEKLAGHFGKLVISDDNSKKRLLEKAEHSYPTGNSLDIFIERDFPEITYVKKTENGDKIVSQKIEEIIDKIVSPTANYVFLSDKTRLDEYKCLTSLTPYAIIGNKEVEAIKRLFYKAYDANTREAISSLGIKDLFMLYNMYAHNKDFPDVFCNFEKFKKDLLEFLKTRTYDSSNDTRASDVDEAFGISEINLRLKQMGINFTIPPIEKAGWIKKQSVQGLTKLLQKHTFDLEFEDSLKSEFLKFIFELPYEERNLEMDKFLFQKFNQFLDINSIMLKEYQQGKFFKDFFTVLSSGQQNMVINVIKHSDIQNSDINHYLWMMGSKDIRLDYLNLYKEEAEEFISYFKDRPSEEKKVIIKDIMECDFINDKVTEWLNQNESDLIREVGLNG